MKAIYTKSQILFYGENKKKNCQFAACCICQENVKGKHVLPWAMHLAVNKLQTGTTRKRFTRC